MATYQVFCNVLKYLKISPRSQIGVSVSGGCDSMALALLAKQYFRDNATAFTVDHQLRPNSREEALKVKDLIESHIGMKHELLTVQWPEGKLPTSGKIQPEARDQRYTLLLDECRKRNLSYILLGHQGDDQIETFVLRMCRMSGMMGLACMQPFFVRYGCPSIPIIRPLLTVKKADLKNVCLDNGLNWIEDSSNTLPIYQRNVVRPVLQRHPDIYSDVIDLIRLFQESREICNISVSKALEKIHMNTKYGYVTMKYDLYRKLSDPVAKKLINVLLRFASNQNVYADFAPITSNLTEIHRSILKNKDRVHGTGYGGVVYQHDKKSFAVARRLDTYYPNLTPINIGETILWDNRFYLNLDYLDNNTAMKSYQSHHSFYVRHLIEKDLSQHSGQGIRKVKSVKLPHRFCRNGLPILVAEHQDLPKEKWPVVAIPVLKFVNRQFGVRFRCSEFKPKITLQDFQQNLL